MNTHKVLKRIPGCDAEPGAEVNASEWRNAPLLEKQRFIKPLDGVTEPDGQQSEASFDDRVIAVVNNAIATGALTFSAAQTVSARKPSKSAN